METGNEYDNEDSSSEEIEQVPFTFPQVKPLYSRFRSSDGARSCVRTTQLKSIKAITMHEKPVGDAESHAGSCPEHEDGSFSTISNDFFHVDENSYDGVTSIKNEGHNCNIFPDHKNNRGKSVIKTPTPMKLQTPFSTKSTISLVRRIPKNPSTPGFHKNEGQDLISIKEQEYVVDSNAGERQNVHNNGSIENRNGRVLKDILNQNNNFKKPVELDKVANDKFHAVYEHHELIQKSSKNYHEGENVCYLQKSPKGKPVVYTVTRNKRENNGNQMYYHPGEKVIGSVKPKSQNTLLSQSENLRNGLSNGVESRIILVNDIPYSVLSKLGQGGSSEVYLVLDKKSTLLAIKCVNLIDADEFTASGYLKEIEMLSKLQKSNRVIKLIDHEYNKQQQTLFVVMEKGDTDLSTLLKQISKTGDVSLPMVVYYWTEMLQAVKEIHDHGIVHADLKPANFLLVCGRLKLIDFGIASAIQNDATSVIKSSMYGTCNYMSPEAIQDPGDSSRTKVGYKSDVWSLGCILYNLLYRKTPFQHIVNNLKKLQMIANANHSINFPLVDKCPPPLMEAMKLCLTYDAKKRPTVAELLSINYIWPGE